MKIEFKKPLPITMLIIIASISTIIFGIFTVYSIHNGNNFGFRILSQGSLCLMMLLNGVNCFVYQKQKLLGSFLWLVSGFLLFVMIDTIIVAGGI